MDSEDFVLQIQLTMKNTFDTKEKLFNHKPGLILNIPFR